MVSSRPERTKSISLSALEGRQDGGFEFASRHAFDCLREAMVSALIEALFNSAEANVREVLQPLHV